MSLSRFMKKAGLLAALAGATLGAVFYLPASERTSYLAAIIDKEKRLESLPPGKVILVGGSNLAFGIDSRVLETALHRPVVNMGLHAGVGIPFMLNQVRSHVAAGDVIVLSPEYETFFEEPTPQVFCAAALQLPHSWRTAGAQGYARCVATTFVETVQHNVRWRLRRILRVPEVAPHPAYRRGSFNRWGDVDAHVAQPPRTPAPVKEPGRIEGEPDAMVIDTLRDFARYASHRGARVFFIHPACSASAYGPYRNALRALDRRLRRALEPEVTFLSSPEDSFFPPSMIFDTVYHLTGRGRALRTQRVVAALSQSLQ